MQFGINLPFCVGLFLLVINMALVQRNGRKPGWTHKETLADGVTSDPIIIPTYSERVTCTVVAGANTAKIQSTTSPEANVLAATATWQDWPAGNKTGTYSDSIISPCTAVRGVSVSGEIVFEVVM